MREWWLKEGRRREVIVNTIPRHPLALHNVLTVFIQGEVITSSYSAMDS